MCYGLKMGVTQPYHAHMLVVHENKGDGGMYPKTLNCRLSDDDFDIKEDLKAHALAKTERIKAVYRMGLRYEAELHAPKPITLIPTDERSHAFIVDMKRTAQPTPLLYTNR